jgi:hypothetical protein
MKKTTIALAIASLLFMGFGCGKKSASPAPAVNAPEAPAKPPGLPRETSEQFDEEDHLDAALKDLEAVE